MRGSRILNNLTGMPFGPLDLFLLSDWIIEYTSLGNLGGMKKLLFFYWEHLDA